MSREETQFAVLPNEVVYCIFDFLTAFDILRAFAQLTRRYTDLIRFYIKRLDLTEDWQGEHHQLQWICETIQILKVDQRHIYFLSDYLFSQLHSLSLVDVANWQDVMSRMNLRNLCLCFNDDTRDNIQKGPIPRTVIRFSANVVLKANIFHAYLIYLNVNILSIYHLLEIVRCTPKVQHLLVTSAISFNGYHSGKNDEPCRFEALTFGFRCLTDLQHLSIHTTHVEVARNYYSYLARDKCLPFDQIELFIDRCCPGKAVLKRVALKLDHMKLCQHFWPTFERYKKDFDRFDFYISVIVEDKTSDSIEIPPTLGRCGFHVEGIDASYLQGNCVHVYSLPFAFDNLHGFTSCSELNAPSSFSAVRHLYFTRAPFIRSISFRSLATYMPQLTSIDCHLAFHEPTTLPDLTVDPDAFYDVRSLHFTSFCQKRSCVCHDLLPRLLDRMPRLRSLTTPDNSFTRGQHPLPSIKILDMRQSNLESLETLSDHFPHLSTLLLGQLILDVERLSRILGSLFIRIPSLSLVFYEIFSMCSQDRTPYGKIARQALALAQKMDNCLRHVHIDFGPGIVKFSRQNS